MHLLHHENEGKSLAHDNDKKEMCGPHGLKDAVHELKEEHASGSKHLPVRDMKGLDRK